MIKITKIIKTGPLFKLVFLFVIIKFLLGGVYVYSEYVKSPTQREGSMYNCPPEFSDFLVLEKRRLLDKERELEAREKELKLLEKKLQEQMNALTALSQEVEEKLNKITAVRDERIKLLVKAYAEMSPKKAAEQLLNMDRDMAIKILSQMKSNQVASILSAMPPEKAANLAEALSGYPPREY
ncbi:MAG: MotE family protein [Caldimicrobium sp.]